MGKGRLSGIPSFREERFDRGNLAEPLTVNGTPIGAGQSVGRAELRLH